MSPIEEVAHELRCCFKGNRYPWNALSEEEQGRWLNLAKQLTAAMKDVVATELKNVLGPK